MCVTVGSKGMHSVCVCEQHNSKLLVAALFEHLGNKDLSELACNSHNKKCVVQSSSQCLGRSNLQSQLDVVFNNNAFDIDDKIKFKQWIHTDGTKLLHMQLLVIDFVDILVKKFDL